MRVLTDFHHSSLLMSTNLLLGIRLNMEVYRPIGMEWFDEGYWAINQQRDTAEQFLAWHSQPMDGTPQLNDVNGWALDKGWGMVQDPGGNTLHKACSLEFFQNTEFDYVIASIPQHVPIFENLIAKFQPKAKLIVQMGNNWDIHQYQGKNVLASLKPIATPGVNALFYHQEFDLEIFAAEPARPDSRCISSFVNVIEKMPQAWTDFKLLEHATRTHGFTWKAYGGQCRDGNMTGPQELADKMREAMLIFHVKPGGDGFGHIIHNAYAVGRPIITRSSHYRNTLAESLLVPGTFIDLDKHDLGEAKNMISRLLYMPDQVKDMSAKAAATFRAVVDYETEAKEVSKWLETLR